MNSLTEFNVSMKDDELAKTGHSRQRRIRHRMTRQSAYCGGMTWQPSKWTVNKVDFFRQVWESARWTAAQIGGRDDTVDNPIVCSFFFVQRVRFETADGEERARRALYGCPLVELGLGVLQLLCERPELPNRSEQFYSVWTIMSTFGLPVEELIENVPLALLVYAAQCCLEADDVNQALYFLILFHQVRAERKETLEISRENSPQTQNCIDDIFDCFFSAAIFRRGWHRSRATSSTSKLSSSTRWWVSAPTWPNTSTPSAAEPTTRPSVRKRWAWCRSCSNNPHPTKPVSRLHGRQKNKLNRSRI